MSHWKFWMPPSPRSSVGKPRWASAHSIQGFSPSALLRLLISSFCTVICLSSTVAEVRAADKIDARLSVSDAVTAPGRPVMLEARLIQSGRLVDAGLGGELLEFVVSGKKVGTAMTGGDGRAYLEYTPKMRGNQILTVRLGPSKRVEATEANAIIASWEKRRPILLVERAALMEQEGLSGPLPSLGLGLSYQDPTPATGASEELKRLSEFYFNVVYVERAGDKTPEGLDLRDWLHRHGFPFGLRVRVKDGRGSAVAEKLSDLRAEGWENLKAGVGRSHEFGEGVLQHRLRVILLTEEKAQDLPRKAQPARDWREVRKLLQG
jgi:hypothetical protein